ncbi:MAG: ATP-binding cassette domain-containing protein [Spongiibacteraceae bacterium]|jgi:ATP-binding cassette subfamily F protein 3|nr:ATP-binding cassette domain-containing protein [Spongiibacteraceae bacterium]
MIELQSVTLHRGDKTLLEGASLRIHPGEKSALVGANGAGKTTLFMLLEGRIQIDAGTVSIPQQWRIAHMKQEVPAGERLALDYVLDGDSELRRIQAELAQEPAGERLAQLHAELDAIDGYNAERRAEQLLRGLGFPGDQLRRPVSDFSGGWRIRLNLAQALMCPADLLLLDEPTNHLDLDASLWLAQWLKRFQGTLLLISHDRDFIDDVCEQIVHIEQQQLFSYRGNYSAFERQRAERLAQQQIAFEKQQARRAHIQSFIDRFRAKATKAKQAQSRIKELERMERLAPAHVDSPFDFSFREPERFSDPLLSISQGAAGYGEHQLLSGLNLSIHPGTRLGLLGANGAGKSTLLKTLAGALPLLQGERVTGEHTRIGYFTQHQLEALDLDASPLLHVQRLSPTAREQEIRDFLGGFNFRGDRATNPIRHSSGGEKARLALALIVWQRPNLLLLDEPTNHLDLEMCHALTVALQAFEGAVVIISHDRHLLRNTVDDLLLVANGRVQPFDGDLNDYSRWLLAQARETRNEEKNGKAAAAAAPVQPVDRKAQRQQAAEQRQRLAPLKKQIDKTERALEKLNARLAEIEQTLADPTLYDAGSKDALQQLLVEQGALRSERDQLEEQWLGLQEEYEAAAG